MHAFDRRTDRQKNRILIGMTASAFNAIKNDQYISVNNILVIKFCLAVEPTSEGNVRS